MKKIIVAMKTKLILTLRDADNKYEYPTPEQYADALLDDDILPLKSLMSAIWKYIGKTGTELTNANLDYVVEQAVKELQNER